MRLVRVKAEEILGKPLTSEQRAELALLKNRPDSEIDYSDIPPLTEEQLERSERDAKDAMILNRQAARLNREAADVLEDQD